MSEKKKKHRKNKREIVEEADILRRCLSCREQAKKTQLCRFVRSPDGDVDFDVRSLIQSRGAYSCASKNCLEKAILKGGFKHAFKEVVQVDLNMIENVMLVLEKEIINELALHNKARKIIVGRDRALAEAEKKQGFIMIASDISSRSKKYLIEKCHSDVSIKVGPTMQRLSEIFASDMIGVVHIAHLGQLTRRLKNDLLRFSLLVNEKIEIE